MDGSAWKPFGISVLELGLRRTFLPITEANSMNSSVESFVANSDLLTPRDLFRWVEYNQRGLLAPLLLKDHGFTRLLSFNRILLFSWKYESWS